MAPSLKADFASGLVVLLPLLVCLYVLRWIYRRVAGFPLVEHIAPQLPVLSAISDDFSRVVFTLILLVALLFVIGYSMRTAVGVLLESQLDAAINRLPVFRMIYNASKVAVETAVDDVDVQEPVRIRLWGDVRLTGFDTGKQTSDERRIVFVPTSPNVTSGFVVEIRASDVDPTGESVESALGRVISAGFGEEDQVDRETLDTFGISPDSGSDESTSGRAQTSEQESAEEP